MDQMVSFGDRLREERERLRLNQTAFAATGGVTKKTQMLYEAGERFPDVRYLAALQEIGCDVSYVVTGQRGESALSAEERLLLERYRESPKPLRDAALRVLLGAELPVKPGQVFQSEVSQAVQVSGNLDQTGISFNMGGAKKKK